MRGFTKWTGNGSAAKVGEGGVRASALRAAKTQPLCMHSTHSTHSMHSISWHAQHQLACLVHGSPTHHSPARTTHGTTCSYTLAENEGAPDSAKRPSDHYMHCTRI
jgi:hypothetical protein